MAEERLQKVLAAAGVASRRASEELITEGKVRVNGKVVTLLGTKVDPDHDTIAVGNKVIRLDSEKRYFMLNKPRSVVASMADDVGRRDLSEFVTGIEERVYNVGRLDYETSGLLVLTNDGALAHALAHPSFEVPKTYLAKVRGVVNVSTVKRLLAGVTLEDGFIKADKVRIKDTSEASSMIEVTIHSGRNRIIRRMFDAVGHPVMALSRQQFGPLRLGTLTSGKLRELSDWEVKELLTLAKPEAVSQRKRAARPAKDGRDSKFANNAKDAKGAKDRGRANDRKN